MNAFSQQYKGGLILIKKSYKIFENSYNIYVFYNKTKFHPKKKTSPNAFGNEIEYANIDAVTGTNFRKDSQYGLCFHYFF
ncbi:hypothetical protein B0E44_11455 [Flavobacterium sp. A45]|nr:hypothetical protein B0E44_11455 [Flavobacterium sp. A45]